MLPATLYDPSAPVPYLTYEGLVNAANEVLYGRLEASRWRECFFYWEIYYHWDVDPRNLQPNHALTDQIHIIAPLDEELFQWSLETVASDYLLLHIVGRTHLQAGLDVVKRTVERWPKTGSWLLAKAFQWGDEETLTWLLQRYPISSDRLRQLLQTASHTALLACYREYPVLFPPSRWCRLAYTSCCLELLRLLPPDLLPIRAQSTKILRGVIDKALYLEPERVIQTMELYRERRGLPDRVNEAPRGPVSDWLTEHGVVIGRLTLPYTKPEPRRSYFNQSFIIAALASLHLRYPERAEPSNRVVHLLELLCTAPPETAVGLGAVQPSTQAMKTEVRETLEDWGWSLVRTLRELWSVHDHQLTKRAVLALSHSYPDQLLVMDHLYYLRGEWPELTQWHHYPGYACSLEDEDTVIGSLLPRYWVSTAKSARSVVDS